MVCAGLETLTDTGIAGILSYPNSCDPNFWLIIMGALFTIITLTLFQIDRSRETKADIISSAGVSAIAIIFLSLIGTLVGFITTSKFITILVLGGVIITIWMLKD